MEPEPVSRSVVAKAWKGEFKGLEYDYRFKDTLFKSSKPHALSLDKALTAAFLPHRSSWLFALVKFCGH